jgi:hypothetical protein
MVRYLAFQGQSSDKHAAAYAPDGLPLVAGLTKLAGDRMLVLERGRWVPGASWTPDVATPASPGWVSEESTFAYAAAEALRAVTGRSFAADAARLARSGVAEGIETAADEAAGRQVGAEVGRLVLAKAQRVVG